MEITLSPSLLHDVGWMALTVGGATLQGWLAWHKPQAAVNLNNDVRMDGVIAAIGGIGEVDKRTKEILGNHSQRLEAFEQGLNAIGNGLNQVMGGMQGLTGTAEGQQVYATQLGQAMVELSERLDRQSEVLSKIVERLERGMPNMPEIGDLNSKLSELQGEFRRRQLAEPGR
jgi:methyl-accepting chemotaxis protein